VAGGTVVVVATGSATMRRVSRLNLGQLGMMRRLRNLPDAMIFQDATNLGARLRRVLR
jgi:hypothetical protein